jgi:hypothetical protein
MSSKVNNKNKKIPYKKLFFEHTQLVQINKFFPKNYKNTQKPKKLYLAPKVANLYGLYGIKMAKIQEFKILTRGHF